VEARPQRARRAPSCATTAAPRVDRLVLVLALPLAPSVHAAVLDQAVEFAASARTQELHLSLANDSEHRARRARGRCLTSSPTGASPPPASGCGGFSCPTSASPSRRSAEPRGPVSPLYQWRHEWMKAPEGSEGVFEGRRVVVTMTCGPCVVVSPPGLYTAAVSLSIQTYRFESEPMNLAMAFVAWPRREIEFLLG
jgi:hypothetical protein